MRPFILLTLLSLIACREPDRFPDAVEPVRSELHHLAISDLSLFAERIAGSGNGPRDKATNVVTWFAENFDWSATDYQRRSVQQVLERGAGNCNELALITTAALDSLGLRMRKIREINLHVEDGDRQTRAAQKVSESGLTMSVFGRHHNDHVWIEILDADGEGWFPADPSLGVVGEDVWLGARLSFADRYSLDPASEDMIAPFAVFATTEDGKLLESRSRHYLIEGFDNLYDGRLRSLSPWHEWEHLVTMLDEKAAGAFGGTVNLHEYEDDIARLAEAYNRLKLAYGSRYRELAPPR